MKTDQPSCVPPPCALRLGGRGGFVRAVWRRNAPGSVCGRWALRECFVGAAPLVIEERSGRYGSFDKLRAGPFDKLRAGIGIRAIRNFSAGGEGAMWLFVLVVTVVLRIWSYWATGYFWIGRAS